MSKLQDAALEVFNRFHPRLFILARPEDRDDIRQHVVLLTMEAMLKVEVKDPIAYAKTIAWQARFGIDARRNRPTVELDRNIPSSDRLPLESILEQERYRLIPHLWSLAGLYPAQKKALSRFMAGMSVEQICRDMKITDAQWRVMKSKALSKMREVVKEQGL
jgi:hypothetical protein